jgi:hypothetical protein
MWKTPSDVNNIEANNYWELWPQKQMSRTWMHRAPPLGQSILFLCFALKSPISVLQSTNMISRSYKLRRGHREHECLYILIAASPHTHHPVWSNRWHAWQLLNYVSISHIRDDNKNPDDKCKELWVPSFLVWLLRVRKIIIFLINGSQEIPIDSQLLRNLYPKSGSSQLANPGDWRNDLSVIKMGGHPYMIACCSGPSCAVFMVQ